MMCPRCGDHMSVARAAELMWEYEDGSRDQRILADLAVRGNPSVHVCDDCGNYMPAEAGTEPQRLRLRSTGT